MEGLKDGVDALGGVTVENDLEFTQDGIYFPKGKLTLNGEEALAYARMRKQDSRGDLGRNMRQQQIISAMVSKATSFDSFTRVQMILDAVGNNVQTNAQMEEMRKLFMNYRGTRNDIVREEIKGTGQMIGRYWYYVVSDEEVNRIRQILKNHMDHK